ncbi:hypothetical protein [Chryseolinea lacunae]|uniref:Uncharacterized protein n=1 Tax=Chryseolinea lacunae TaxID=2801331 RepID=A0ABS1KPQ1_9BACT|nr:hypothetical protein [Chryseolinea lacunae]MBL0741445.1 hypothetical protein [Chryseolinea lacunae]
MEQEQTLTPQDSLALIRDVINKTTDNINHHSFVFMLWGWLIAGASLLRYAVEVVSGADHFFYPLPAAGVIGVVTTLFYYKRMQRTVPETYLNYFIKKLWLVLGIGFVCVVLVSVFQNIPPFTYTLIVAGIGTLATGLVMRFRPVQVGGAIFLLASVVCALVPDVDKALVHGIAIVAGYLVPGYLLKHAKPRL